MSLLLVVGNRSSINTSTHRPYCQNLNRNTPAHSITTISTANALLAASQWHSQEAGDRTLLIGRQEEHPVCRKLDVSGDDLTGVVNVL